MPAKDGFWSTAVQSGHPYRDNRTEPHSALHAAVATLSRGPVTPGDKIGSFNVSLIMRSCRTDGRLLQPDTPALALDAQLVHVAAGGAAGGVNGELWATSTTVSVGGAKRHDHVLAVNISVPYAVAPAELDAHCGSSTGSTGSTGSTAAAVVFDSGNFSSARPFDAAHPLRVRPCGLGDFGLYHTAPVLPNGWALLGEASKWVPVSAARVLSYGEVAGGVVARVVGVAGEVVEFGFFDTATGQVHTASCTFAAAATAQLVVNSNGTCGL